MVRLALTVLLAFCLGVQFAGAAEVGALLDRAAERALSYDRASLEWTCEETVRLARYDGAGEASRESERHFALLMRRDAPRQAAVELRAAGSSAASVSTRRPRVMEGFPPTTSWLRLFHPDVGGFVLFQDAGEDTTNARLRHAFTFRGALPYARGDDFREWEGTAWLDPATGDLLAVEASPSSQHDRLAKLVDRRNRHSLDVVFFIVGFRIGPRAHGRRVEVSFGTHEGGFWLPDMARLETFEAVNSTATRPLTVVVDSLSGCRRFETDAVPSEARPEPR